jgi:putative copper resistance protein D
MDAMTVALFGSRLVQYAAVMVLLGGSFFPLYAGAELSGTGKIGEVFSRWLQRVLLSAALLSLLSSLTWLSIEAAMMGDGWSDAVSGSTLSVVLLQTGFGRVWIVHLALAGLVAVGLLAFRRATSIAAMRVVAGLSGALVASLAWTGHAVMTGGPAGAIDVTAQAIHLLAASVWLGGLVPLGYLFMRARQDLDSAWLAAARRALPRYSQTGIAAVSLILLTGVFISWSLVGSLSALGRTTYGLVLLAKIALFLLLVGIALVNRLDLLPRVIHWHRSASAETTLAKLSRNIAMEQAVGIAVLAVVSVLGTLPPADHSAADSAGLAPSSRVALGIQAEPWPATVHRADE